jgi:hypothetical protein
MRNIKMLRNKRIALDFSLMDRTRSHSLRGNELKIACLSTRTYDTSNFFDTKFRAESKAP